MGHGGPCGKHVVPDTGPLGTVSGVTEVLKVFDKPCRPWVQETGTSTGGFPDSAV
jgi:hypothetical protein